MKRKILFQLSCFLFLLSNFQLNAQTWQSKINASTNGLIRDIAVGNTGDGYIYHGKNTFFKIDEFGTISRIYAPFNTSFSGITNIKMLNNSYIFCQSPAKLIKMNTDGTTAWEFEGAKSISNNLLVNNRMATFTTENGNIIFTGLDSLYIIDEATGVANAQYAYGNDYACAAISIDANDNYAILARVPNGAASLIQMSKTGSIISTTPLNMTAYDMTTVSDGYLIVGDDGTNSVIKKINFSGTELWSNTYGLGSFHSIQPKLNDFVISGSNGSDGIMVKINGTGNQLWSKTYTNIISPDARTAVINTNDNKGQILATTTHLLKTDNNGDVQMAEKDLYLNGAAILDVNNVAAMVNPNGSLFWDYNDAYFKSPKNGDVSSIFASGLWMGGFDNNGNLKMSAQTYNSSGTDYAAGFSGMNATDMEKVWRISKAEVKQLRRDFDANNAIDGQVPHDILTYPAKGNPNARGLNGAFLPIPNAAAPFVDKNFDGIYNVYDGDYPVLYGDMQVVWLMNDDIIHTQTLGDPLKFDIIGMMYANECSSDGLVDNTIFLKYIGKNNSTSALDSFHLGMWTDFDLGCYSDDYVGSLPSHNSFYVYNQNANDGQSGCSGTPSYSTNIPIQSVTFLNQASDFYTSYYVNNIGGNTGGLPTFNDPTTTLTYYNLLTGTWVDGTPQTYGGNGYGGATPTNVVFDGNPAIATDWTMADSFPNGADVRMIGAVELPSVQLGQEFTVEFAYITHENIPHPNPDIVPIGQRISQIQTHYDANTLNWDVYLGADKELTIGQPLTITATIEGGGSTSNYTYLWSNGATTPSINATAPIEYSVTVTNTLTGCSKTDAVQVYFTTSTAEKATEIDKVAVFPNPAQDVLQINISQLADKNIAIQLIDVTGRTLKTVQNQYTDIVRFDVSDVAAGVYYLSFLNENMEKIGVKKVVILN